MEDETAIRAAEGGAEKSEYVRGIFSEIAPRYDLLNHLLSMNIDRVWRRRAIADLRVDRRPQGQYLDLCAGTLDISVAVASVNGFTGKVIGADFAEPMLRAGRAKLKNGRIAPVVADALALPLESGSMCGVIVAFGIRNVADLDAGLREVHRVLEPGGRFVILEFSRPRSRPINAAYQLYFNRVLPVIGGFISGHRTAYSYLPRSVANFPVEEALVERMEHAGFRNVYWQRLSFGIAAIHVGEKG
ncbi:MAG TPA: bifunctional demethylmenaquinone methyltransferase/2-methoxy-6-polyprenyl-1,4-benzoquinol methylase UbiE [Gemmatimonadaceae bacterium]|nr:bifunctional demethylmenaquinone methyltransferase/2-methoxy-6-polyprenyl-1,4-benzoquinol methylase UbiE [Gemmatimonadaceae bacterium]